MPAVSLLAILFSFIGCMTAPHIEPCDIINAQYANCVPTDTTKAEYMKPIKKMRGYKAFSPSDWGAMRKYLRKLIRQLDEL